MMEEKNGDESCEENEVSSPQQYCSFAVSGKRPLFQEIYICRDCSPSEQELLCICQACAERCHEEHEGLEYIGMGPSYCDCHGLKVACALETASRDVARRLGIADTSDRLPSAVEPTSADEMYIRDAYEIDSLKDDVLRQDLFEQAQALVTESKETFWLNDEEDVDTLCGLERLALSILKQHLTRYNLRQPGRTYGAEWWVQVKPVSLPREEQSRLDPYHNGSEAVDLHYDKDEELAESFGLGFFPRLSTVTYLTDSRDSPPTVVFSRRYDMLAGDNTIPAMMVSHPRKGKHIVFDGRLLHGAPSHYALRPLGSLGGEDRNEDVRITFLVNVWVNHRPAGVRRLPLEIRQRLQSGRGGACFNPTRTEPMFADESVRTFDLTSEDILPESLRGRIELPFLGQDATWGNGDEESGTRLSTFPPPEHDCSTLIVRFGPGLEALLVEVDEYDEDGEDSDG